MIGDLKPYPTYKDSGMPRLGEVPEHWEVRRLKRVCRLAYGDSLPTEAREEGAVPVFGSNGRVGLHSSANTKAPCIVVGRKGSFGKVNFSAGPLFAIDTTFFIDDRFTESSVRWLFYLLGWLQLDEVSKDSAVPGLDREEAYQRVVPLPPLPEQSAMVRFLDHVDRRIRRYIRAKKKLIELLNEQKQAIIHRAVTRGLNHNARLKPSGVEWLGDVPEHWELVRNGRLFIQRNEIGFPELPILEVSLKTGVRIRDFESSDRKQVMADRSKYKRAAKGDIAYNMMRMWQGAVGVTPVDGLVSPAYVVAKPLEETEPRYFSALFRTSAYMGEVDKYSRGIVKDRNRLYWEDFKQMSTICPPPNEQVAVANAIDQRTATIDDGIHRIEREISLVCEYRTRLIADVVTGKLDVREAAARLPEEAEEPEPLEDADALAEGNEEGEGAALDATTEEAET